MKHAEAKGSGIKKDAQRIDLHHHFLPSDYAALLRQKGIRPGGVEPPSWTPEASRRVMEHNGIQSALLSASTPGAWFGEVREARLWARRLNETAAQIVQDDPRHFGFFATLTLPDLQGSLAEAEYALDELGADGIVLMANHVGKYLGDPDFAPLMDFLDERSVVVFVHPGELPAQPVPGIPSFLADFMLDTTRTALSLIMSGTMERCSRIRFVLAHAGGFLPYIAYRVVLGMANELPKWEQLGLGLAPEHASEHFLLNLRKFWYDVALSSTPTTFPTLLEVADPERIVYGSDFPFAPAPAVRFMRQHYERTALRPAQRRGIDRANAEKLFPRFAL